MKDYYPALPRIPLGTVLRAINFEEREVKPYGGDIDLVDIPLDFQPPKRRGEYEIGKR